jgi:zinc/manganese transport system substrate-binding protein
VNRSRLLAPVAIATALGLGLGLTGCAADTQAADPAKTGTIAVVASIDVWGSVAEAIGGDHVDVTSIIDDPSKDPHDYQADARNQLAISRANVVVANGGGYDDFVAAMVKAAKQHPEVVTVAGLAGAGHANEHYWYDFPTVQKLADELASTFAQADPGDAADFRANAQAFAAELQTLEAGEARLKAEHAGTSVTITEPVPLYLLDAIGLKNITPARFSAAIESDTDVAPTVLKQVLDLYRAHRTKLLVYNEQTSGPQTQAVIDAAEKAGVATVPVTETLPRGKNYIEWMTSTLQAIGGALDD